ncbi:hypothetical protein LCGC14_2637670 [marine sediment metagenome]|uniref:Uncharacterized protein n=1 Tax=marine sediment metagenome TaxID=412755 RepID=A0A0F8ZYM2_9ZZZZ
MKSCTKCRKELPETSEFFYREKKGRNGLRSVCKKCASNYDKNKNVDKIKKNKYQRDYYKKRRVYFLSIRYIHQKLRRQNKIPKYCTICNQPKKLELASINHSYSEDIKKYLWLCHECHALFDIEQRGVIIGH